MKVSLSAEQLATHGDVIGAARQDPLGRITKIGYQIKAASRHGRSWQRSPAAATEVTRFFATDVRREAASEWLGAMADSIFLFGAEVPRTSVRNPFG